MKYIRIDPHVHCRDGKESYKSTIASVFKLADNQGIKKIFDMPNTDPPILTGKDVLERLKLVPDDRKKDYYLYIGATCDKSQLGEAVECYNRFNQVVGIKLYAGKSIGNLAVVKPDDQRLVYETLAELGYDGVLAVHCERDDYIVHDLWCPHNPISHSYARTEEAEIEAVKDQIRFTKASGFRGILHICHVSCPESVRLVNNAKNRHFLSENGHINITCGITPHHILFSSEALCGLCGLLYKSNPPLRALDTKEELIGCLREGLIDWIESDHAPHDIKEKLGPPYLSGIDSLIFYKDLAERALPEIGISADLIKKMTSDNIYRAFKNKLNNN